MRFQREIHYYKNLVKPSSSFQHLCTSQLPPLLFLSPLISTLAVRLKSVWIKHNINQVKCILSLAKVTVAWNVCSWMHCSQNFTIFKTCSFRVSTDCWSSLNDWLLTNHQLTIKAIHSKQYTDHRIRSQECLCPRNFKSNKQVTYQLFSAKLQPLPVDDDEYFASGEPGQVQLRELSNHTAVLSGDIWGAKCEEKLSLNLH